MSEWHKRVYQGLFYFRQLVLLNNLEEAVMDIGVDLNGMVKTNKK